MKPDVIRDYNKTMGGVDTLSRVINPYSIQKKGLKWYRKIGELFIDIAIYNAFIVWKKLNVGDKTNHLQFRQNLAKAIVTFHLSGQCTPCPGRGETVNQRNNPLRLIERHFPTQKNQATGRKRSRCVRCTKMGIRRETTFECRKCDVALCAVPCFEIYHTLVDITNGFDDVHNSDDSESTE